MSKKKFLYILSGNLSTTPRALQSIKTALNNYKVDIIGVNRNNIWKELDKKLVNENNLNYKLISLQRKPFFQWFFCSIIHKIAKLIYPFFSKNLKITAYASSKTMFLLNNEILKTIKKYDFVIAHSYSSFYPAYKLSKIQNIPFSVDIEDFHPGENISTTPKKEIARRKFLLKNILPKAVYLTFASPLIGKHSLELLNNNIPENFLVNNCFSQNEFQFDENKSEKVKFVWFSQNISSGRGLELVIPAFYSFKEKVEITLIGNLYSDFYEKFLVNYSEILKFEKPLPQKELNLKLSEFDIGLAIEVSNIDINKDIALSNKIFAYAQSGLYILATNTQAQKLFIQDNHDLGIICEQNTLSVVNQIEIIINDIENIRKNKQNRYNYSKKLAWENESKKLLKMWNSIL